MSAPGVPEVDREQRRLQALEALHVLGSAPEPEFDAIVDEAARLCDMPMGAIALVGQDRQWFKALRGFELEQTPREVAFCAWTVAEGAPLVVPDTHDDPRFADNPFVLGAPHLRAYFGVPLRMPDGSVLGALSVMDTRPRQLDAAALETLGALAEQVVARLQLRERLRRIRTGEAGELLETLELGSEVLERTRQLTAAAEQVTRFESLYRSLWETTSDAVLMIDAGSIIRYANPGAGRMFGYADGELEGRSLVQLQPAAMRAPHAHGMRRYLETGKRRLDWSAAQTRGLRTDGSVIDIEIAFSEIELDGERLFVGFIRDVSARQRALEALDAEHARVEGVLRCIGDGVVTLDADGRVHSLNPMAADLTGWAEDAARGQEIDAVLCLERDGTPLPLAMLVAAGTFGEPVALPADATLQARDGRRLSVEGSVAALIGRSGRAEGWVIALRDVSVARELAVRVAFQATHDALTGLLNRTAFDARLQAAVAAAAANGRPSSLLYLDLDQFKIVNDTCGHGAGDEMLKQLSVVLRGCVRRGDALARLGGDEFGVLLDDCPREHADAVARTLHDAVSGFVFVWQGQPFPCGASIGHVHFDDGTLQGNEVLSRADEACYVAKDLGRGRIHAFRPDEEVQARVHGEMRWVGALRSALAEERFELHAQPIVALGDDARAPWFEVLLRLREPDGRLVPPMSFIPGAERYDLMPAIDRWVLRRAVRALHARHALGAPLPQLAVNLSGATLRDSAFGEFAAALLRDAALPAGTMVLEITETAAVGHFADAVRLIAQLREAGYRVALDDFGSGLSSFAYLRRLPLDILKIDGSFVRGIVDDPVDRAMVASINEIGHLMGLRTVAEFVEDTRILDCLRAMGVDHAQGFELGRPAPLADWLQALER